LILKVVFITISADMASPIRFACYNLHGFNNGSSGLSDLCQFADIIAIEEH